MKITGYFTKQEMALWVCLIIVIVGSFLIFDRVNFMTLIASMLGVTAILFNAKGNPIGQALMIIFSLLYGIISWSFSYYGEMITYLGMTMPMAAFALISWLRHPYKGRRAEVEVNTISGRETVFMSPLTVVVTVAFYFILEYFGTANLLHSAISVTTSFVAVYLTFRRSPYFSLAYAANDIVLIILWSLATAENTKYLSVTICFVAFLANDIYAFISWKRMQERQSGL